MPVYCTSRRTAATARRFWGPSSLSALNGSSALAHSPRLVCTAEVDRHCASSGLTTAVGVDASFEACPVRSSSEGNRVNSNPKRFGGTATGLSHPQRSPTVRVFSKPAHQLTAAQLAHFTHLRGLLCRLSGIRPRSSEAVRSALRAEEAYHQLPREAKLTSQSLQPRALTKVGQALHSELYVMSRVIASPHHHSLLAEGDAAACDGTVFTGVNHAFHKRVNLPGATLRGILKGCAEQNALGAAAASGCIYADVADVFLLAARSLHTRFDRALEPAKGIDGPASAPCNSCATLGSNAGPSAAQAVATFPCPECWRHLCHVARARLQHERPPLRLFVYAASPVANIQLFTVAQQRAKTMEAPMDVCIVSG
ncbi:hypothetical protein LSCM4_03645 [Leishmania orientalis]|uniref:Uncharacterized protein n=1 Tax=Leishmania orientalis TaxID=2249476 RepID=A0A836HB03_9TRYP|nr:hypothetical protein LSCM4_03645 [Leishmania orientalis]